jgi:uncharacterized protein YndB with AHSA1/START domain
MASRQKLILEFEIRSSPAILYNYISTPSGLVEWFADDVNIRKGKDYTFIWEAEEMKAELVKKVPGKYIRFEWEDAEDGEYFEFEIKKDELTRDIALVITDWCDDDDTEETELLWGSQVQDLKNALGA